MNYDLPPYKPLSHPGKIDICNNLNFNVVISPVDSKINSNVKRPLNEYVPSKTYCVPGDGNCLFSSIAYWITGCSDNCHEIRKLIVESIYTIKTQGCICVYMCVYICLYVPS